MKVTAQSYKINDKNVLSKFDKLFREKIELNSDYKIRKITSREMSLVWFFIGWDLDEPIYILEDSKHTFVLDFSPDGNRLNWIEDIRNMSFYFAWGENGRTNCYRPVVVGQGKKLGVAFEECKDAQTYPK